MAERQPRIEYPQNKFARSFDGNIVRLQYLFEDSTGPKEVSCTIDEEESSRLRKRLAFIPCPEPTSDPCSKRTSNSAKESSPLSACINVSGSERCFTWEGQPLRGQKLPYANYMFERGLRCHQKMWLWLDYSSLIVKATPLLEQCIGELNERADALEFDQKFHFLMNFFLAMGSTEVPEVDGKLGLWTGGYLLPTEVFLQNTGDCDSKAAALCSVIRKTQRVVVFRSEATTNDGSSHAFVGLDVTPTDLTLRNEEMWVDGEIVAGYYDRVRTLEFSGRSYIPIDVTGPGRTKLGEVVEEKAGRYAAIPISTSDDVRPATEPDESCLWLGNSGFSKVKEALASRK